MEKLGQWLRVDDARSCTIYTNIDNSMTEYQINLVQGCVIVGTGFGRDLETAANNALLMIGE